MIMADGGDWHVHRARLAHAIRFGNDDEAADARADLMVCRIRDSVREHVATWGPIPESKLRELSLLLTPEEDK